MDEDQNDSIARRQPPSAQRWKRFLIHLAVFVAVNIFLLVFSPLVNAGTIIVWGVILAIHGFVVWRLSARKRK